MPDTPPKNVCPRCGARGCVPDGKSLRGSNPLCAPFRCPSCGAKMKRCEQRYYTPDEAAAAKDARKQRNREYNRRFKETHPGYDTEWRRRHADEVNAARRKRYRDDPEWREKKCAESREYYAANREKVDERNRAWARANPDRLRVYAIRTHLRNPEKYAAQYKAQWQAIKADPEKHEAYNARRRELAAIKREAKARSKR